MFHLEIDKLTAGEVFSIFDMKKQMKEQFPFRNRIGIEKSL